MIAAVIVALVGAVALALAESAAAVAVSRRHFPPGDWPWAVILAGFGKMALTHLIVWGALLLAAGAIASVACRRRAPRAFGAPASTAPNGPAPAATAPAGAAPPSAPRSHVPWLAALFVAVPGSVVVATDLVMVNRTSWMYLGGGVLAMLLLAAATYGALRRVARCLRSRRFERLALIASAAALGPLLVGVAAMPGSLPARPSDPGDSSSPVADRAASPATRPADRPPNVLLVVLDTVRADHCSLYGYGRQTTPFLERFAARSAVFERTITPGIWTVPGHASLFTGLSTREHGADIPGRWLDDSRETLAEALRARGYETVGFSNNPWVGPMTNLSQGFERLATLNHYRHLWRFSLEYLCDRWGVTPPAPWLDGDYGAAITNQLVDRWLAARTAAADPRPFFLFVNYMEAHAPYRVPRAYRALFMDSAQVHRSYDLRMSVYGEIADVLHFDFNIEGADFLSQADRDVLARQYDAGIRYLDDRVAELIAAFERRGLLDETLVIITSDHGEYLDEHGMWGHTFLCYEPVTRVPLLVREPGRTRPVRVAAPARLADVFPTVMRLITSDGGASYGHDTRDLLAGGPQAPGPDEPPAADSADTAPPPPPGERWLVTSWSGAEERLARRIARVADPVVKHRGRPQLAIQDGRYKLMISDDGTRELYDVIADPGESQNLLDLRPDDAERLAALLEQWKATVPVFTPAAPASDRQQQTDVLRELKTLGYAGESEPESDPPNAPPARP